MEAMPMATRRKKTAGNSDRARGFTVVVEEMRAQFKVFGEHLRSLDDKVTVLDDKVTAGFAQVDVRFARVEHEIGLLKIAVIEQGRELKKKVDRDEVEAIVERVVVRMAAR
jgi:hypothetical protein